MGREQKAGVDYFSHDVGAHNRKTLSALRQRWGNDGYAFWYILLEILGEQANLSLDCRKKINWVYLCTETRVDEISAAEILGFLSEIEAIDENLWKKHKIIWCQAFVDRLKDVYKKRVRQPQKPVVEDAENHVEPDEERISEDLSKSEESISTAEKPVSGVFPQISAAESTQTKLNYTKQNYTIQQHSSNYVSSTSDSQKVEDYAAAFDAFEKKIGTINQTVYEHIKNLIDDVGLEIYLLAIDKAVRSGSPHFKYIEATAIGIKRDRDLKKGDRQNGVYRKNGRADRASPEKPPKLGTVL